MSVSAKLTEMQRDTERADQLSPSSEDEALVLRQKPSLMQAQEEDSASLQQWKTRQLQRLAEELKAEWQEARLQQVRQAERLYLAQLLDKAAERGNDPCEDEQNQRGTAKHRRARERNRAAFREKGRREGHPRQHPKSRKKVPCSERRNSAKARGPTSGEKGKGRRVSSSKSHGGYQGPRVARRVDAVKRNPFFDGAGETDCVEEAQKEYPRGGRRPSAKGTRFAHNLRDQSLQGKTTIPDQPLLTGPTFKQEAAAQDPPSKYKNQWHKEIESTFEELFNTNRKLKKHLNLHLEQRLKADRNSDEPQSYSDIRSENFGTLREESTEEVETAEESGSPTEVETSEMWSKVNLKQMLSDTEYPRYQQMAKYPLKSESLLPIKAGTSREHDLFSLSPESGQERPKSPAVEDDSLKPYLQKQADSVASWMALRQKQKAELEQRRQKTLLELTEHPNMSLEIHYKAELEEERRERRRMRLALLKSYSTGIHAPVPERHIPLDTGLLDEDKQNQMIRDLQQQILEQNKLHQEFLDKARKRLQEFQKSF